MTVTRWPTRIVQPSSEPERWCTNDSTPDVLFQRQIASGINHALIWRRKAVYTSRGKLAGVYSGAPAGTTTTQGRFYCHTGRAATRMRWVIVMARGPITGVTQPSCTVTMTKVSGGATTTATTYYGGPPSSSTNAPNQWKVTELKTSVDSDADYHGKIEVSDGALVLSALVYEESISDYANWVEPNTFAGEQILDTRREELLTTGAEAWLNNGATILNWSEFEAGFRTTSATTYTNLLDNSSTSVTGATPGYVLGPTHLGRYRRYRERTGGPRAKLAVWAKLTTAAGVTGSVRLQGDDGTTLIEVTGVNSTTAAWYTVEAQLGGGTLDLGNVASGFAKADLQYKCSAGGDTLHVSDVSLYLYDSTR